jgi:hypothetical protein
MADLGATAKRYALQILAEKPQVVPVVERFLAVHAPAVGDVPREDVVVPRAIFDCMAVLCFLALEVLDPSPEEKR